MCGVDLWIPGEGWRVLNVLVMGRVGYDEILLGV